MGYVSHKSEESMEDYLETILCIAEAFAGSPLH